MSNIHILRINGDLYARETKDGKPHGKGVLKYYYDGKAEGKYIGEFKEGRRDGEGIWFINGYRYEGEWKLDKFHGRGILDTLGEIQEGYWFMGSFECHYGDEVKPCNYVDIIK